MRKHGSRLRPVPRVFSHYRFAAFWVAGAVSNTGTWLHIVTSTILVFAYTQSPVALGLFGLVANLPLLLFTLPAGVLSDRVDRRTIVILSHAVSACAAAALAVLVHVGVESFAAVAVAGFVVQSAYAVAKPATSAIFPSLVPRDELGQATAMHSLSFGLGQLGGPLLAAAFVALDAPAMAFVFNAISYLAVMIVVGRLPQIVYRGTGQPIMHDLASGVGYVIRNRTIRSMLVVLAVAAPLPEVMRLMAPAISSRLGTGDEFAGLIATSIGLGSAIGVALASGSENHGHLRMPMWSGLAILGVASLALVLVQSPPIALVAGTSVGLGFGLTFASLTIYIQSVVPEDLRGRVLSIHTLVHLGTRPLFAPVAGGLVALVGLGWTIAAFVLALPLGVIAVVRGDKRTPTDVRDFSSD